jgi:hypothetical protein
MFNDAVVEQVVPTNPCLLKKGDLPKKVDKDPMWRSQALFLREEVEQLMTDVRVPEDRRAFYALLCMAGLRFGEASAMRFSAYDQTAKPLGKLIVGVSYDSRMRREKSVKSQRPREVPVVPALAGVLEDWRNEGWERLFGRAPKADDLMVPTARGTHRNASEGWAAFQEDLERLGLRPRRQHDLRRTFITLARNDGARKDVLEWISHGPRGDIVDIYSSLPWSLLCEELAKLDLRVDRVPVPVSVEAREARSEATERVSNGTPSGLLQPLLQVPVGVTQVLDIIEDKMVTPTGIEPVFSA